jgi:hypothetical protein
MTQIPILSEEIPIKHFFVLLCISLWSCSVPNDSAVDSFSFALAYGKTLYSLRPEKRAFTKLMDFENYILAEDLGHGRWAALDAGPRPGAFGNRVWLGSEDKIHHELEVFMNPTKLRHWDDIVLVDSGGLYENGYSRYGLFSLETGVLLWVNDQAPSWVHFPQNPQTDEGFIAGVNPSDTLQGYIEWKTSEGSTRIPLDSPFTLQQHSQGIIVCYINTGILRLYEYPLDDNQYHEADHFLPEQKKYELLTVSEEELLMLSTDREPGINFQRIYTISVPELELIETINVDQVDLEWAGFLFNYKGELWFQDLQNIFALDQEDGRVIISLRLPDARS